MRNLITNGLKRLVKRDEKYPRGSRNAQVLAVATVKGGVGKTTTAVNLASGLARFESARVLLVDLDAQGHCTTSLSSRLSSSVRKTPVSDILLSDEELEVLDASVPTGLEGLDVTPADSGLAEAEGRIGQKIGKESLLSDALEATRTHYDYIIIDSPPNKGNLTLNALVAADKVLIPTDLSALSVQGADELMGTVMTVNNRLGHDLEVLGVVLTRVDMKKGRPGVRLEALAPEPALTAVLNALFTGTSTIGARYWRVERAVLERTEEVVEWRGQRIRRKRVRLPDGSTRAKPEYEDVVAAARALGLAPHEVRARLDELELDVG